MKKRIFCGLAVVLLLMTLLPVGVKAGNAENLDVTVGETEDVQPAAYVTVESEGTSASTAGEMEQNDLWLILFAVVGLTMIAIAALDDSRKRYE